MQEGFPRIVNVQDDIINLHRMGVLESLLADRTTGGNILWATDAYAERGPQYAPTAEITASLITGPDNAGIIQTRARKAFEQQSSRTRQRAEVFTPAWLVKKMCDHIDEVWFKRKEGFNKIIPDTGKIFFNKNRTWTAYVKSRRMELACGEGPFLFSRYEAPTGEEIKEIRNRVGLLDRKLRVVSENTDSETVWRKWAEKAFQSVYGFEYQGDSLLIARVNALMTFAEHFLERWGHLPKPHEYHAIAEIISWNIWEMDGLTGTVPYRTIEKYPQMLIDGWIVKPMSLAETPKHCVIYDWRRHCEVEYLSLKKKGAGSMKFDYIIGNPPYQEEVQSKGDRANPVYDKFIDEAYGIGEVVELIHPARFLFNAGQTSKSWNQKMLNDEHLKVVYYESDCSKVFSNVEIKGGVAVTLHNNKECYGAITRFTPYQELNSTLRKVKGCIGASFLDEIVSSRGQYRFSDLFYDQYPEAKSSVGTGTGNMIVSNIFDKFEDAFSNEPPESSSDYLRVLGRKNNKRLFKYIKREYVIPNQYIDTYNLMMAEANGIGAFGEVLSTPFISEPGDIATDTFISIGCFGNSDSANALLKYIKTKFARAMLGINKATQHNPKSVWKDVPLQDFSPSSDIDWSKSVAEIDSQLYTKYGLSEEEIAFIESHVKEMT